MSKVLPSINRNLLLALLSINLLPINASAIEAYDASYSNGELTIPIISVSNVNYNVRMILDSTSDLSSISCSGYCFKLISAIPSTTIAPPVYPNYISNIASVQRVWVDGIIYKVLLEYKGELKGYTYFQLRSAQLQDSIFNETPLVLRDPQEYYQNACKREVSTTQNPQIHSVIPVKLNSDKYTDFFVAYQCNLKLELIGTIITTETPSVLVAFVSDNNGNYQVNNEAVFGERYPSYGGAARKHVRGDINGDGFDDFAFAMNWEDGRVGGTHEIDLTQATQPTVILSNGLGKYTIERLGKPSWGHSVDMADNGFGTKDVIFAGFVGENVQAFRYLDSKWINVRDEYPSLILGAGDWAASFKIFPSANRASASTQAVGAYGRDGKKGIALFQKVNGNWERSDEFLLPIDFSTPYITWQKSPSRVDVVSLDGKQYTHGAIDEMCLMNNFQSDNEQLVVAKFFGATRREIMVEGNTYDQKDESVVQVMLFFRVKDGILQRVKSPIVGEITAVNANFFNCIDVNGDGYSDLVILVLSRGWEYDIGGKPLIYLNNREGHLVKIGTENYPLFRSGHSQGNLFDINHDGLMDLILYQQSVQDCCYTNDIRIYLAKDIIGN